MTDTTKAWHTDYGDWEVPEEASRAGDARRTEQAAANSSGAFFSRRSTGIGSQSMNVSRRSMLHNQSDLPVRTSMIRQQVDTSVADLSNTLPPDATPKRGGPESPPRQQQRRVGDRRWVTVSGVPAGNIAMIIHVLAVKFGEVATHRWPGPGCNFFHAKFAAEFDAERALTKRCIQVSTSPPLVVAIAHCVDHNVIHESADASGVFSPSHISGSPTPRTKPRPLEPNHSDHPVPLPQRGHKSVEDVTNRWTIRNIGMMGERLWLQDEGWIFNYNFWVTLLILLVIAVNTYWWFRPSKVGADPFGQHTGGDWNEPEAGGEEDPFVF